MEVAKSEYSPSFLNLLPGQAKQLCSHSFCADIVSDPRFEGNDVAFVWFSFSEDSYEQSKKKLFDYYGGAAELDLIDLNDLFRGKLRKNNVFFINWQKIKENLRTAASFVAKMSKA